MNNLIKILDPHEAIKIAAGEVIERPANIIKELLENSIDAQAKNITLYLKSAGKDYIKIVDDGIGMSAKDAMLCFAHHATSKISKVDDLNSITTYGFRGEALSSIAAISKVELITKTHDEKIATSITFQNSKCIKQEPAAHQTGTSFIITNLFDNIPARKKFLKTDETEWNQILSIFQAFCLRYLDISFKIFHNDILMYNCHATENIATRSGQLWNSNLHEQLIDIPKSTTKNITLQAALSTPHYYRFNRGQIFIFVNNRWVKNHELIKAIMQGYEGVLPHQKYPAVFLFIEIDPKLIDVNIHPKKEEIKFLNPGIAQQVVSLKIQEALSNFINQKINSEKKVSIKTDSLDIALDQNIFNDDPFDTKVPEKKVIFPASLQEPVSNNLFSTPFISKPIQKIDSPIFQPKAQEVKTVDQTEEINVTLFKEEELYSIIGQYHKTYIIIEQSDELILVDQHAAHERIIYQRLKNQGTAPSIQLMFPHVIKLSAQAITKIHSQTHLLSEHGILIDQLSETEVIITATPVGMQIHATEEIIKMIADMLEHQDHLENLQINEKIITQKACKTACKAGDTLEITQMQNVIKELMITPNRFCCPHGRPTMYTMQLKEIEKHFKRDYVGNKQKNIDVF